MKRAKFSLSNKKLLSCDMGELVPCGLLEVLPGDTVQQATSALVRCAPMLAPVMHPVHTRIHHWFVPHRLVWDDWEDFITGGPDGNNDAAFPTVQIADVAVGTLSDYLGIPLGTHNEPHSALPYRGYAMIWNEWYRDQDLQTELTIDTSDGVDTTTNRDLQHVAWEKDYFTAARPWEQKGPAITIPIGTTAPVRGIGMINNVYASAAANVYEAGNSTTTAYAINQNKQMDPSGANGQMRVQQDPTRPGYPNIFADLSSASAITVTALREALALQRFEEARARYGSRYVEYLRYLGVKSSDARLQRPEYLGGGSQVIQFSEVLQTAEGDNPVGEMAGHGIGAMRSNRYRRFFEEHGYVFSFISTKPTTIYTQGLARTWNRRIKEDFWTKELEHVGQQEILNKEIYAAHATPDGTFGWSDRYAEYRSTESTVSGEFRTTLLDFWHFARQFASAPALNAAFVKATPTDVPFAVPSQDVLYCMCNHSIQARRLVSRSAQSFIY